MMIDMLPIWVGVKRIYNQGSLALAEKIRDLMHANLFDVFNERDPERRIAAIAKTYTGDVVFSDPDEIVTGREALNNKAQKRLDKAPGFEGQPPVVSGMDIAIVKEGRIATLYTLLTS